MHYVEFRHHLGRSDKVFRQLSQNVAQCLLNINDVLQEIFIIKSVLDHQCNIWESMHQSRPGPQGSLPRLGDSSHRRCVWGFKDCNPDEVKASCYFNVDKIERDAYAVQAKVKLNIYEPPSRACLNQKLMRFSSRPKIS